MGTQELRIIAKRAQPRIEAHLRPGDIGKNQVAAEIRGQNRTNGWKAAHTCSLVSLSKNDLLAVVPTDSILIWETCFC